MPKQVDAEIRDDELRQAGRQVALAHAQDALNDGDHQEQQDRLRHAFHVPLNRDEVPQRAAEFQQRQVEGRHAHDQDAG